jgi:hypothetical protein
VTIRDDHIEVLGVGEVGEVWLRGLQVEADLSDFLAPLDELQEAAHHRLVDHLPKSLIGKNLRKELH